MRNPARCLARLRIVASLGACAGVSAASVAWGAPPPTPTPPLPNVMLLIDTSGSMENMIDGSDPASNADTVHCGSVTSACSVTSQTNGSPTCPNRWGNVLQTLTGEFPNGYRCMAQDRSGTPFKNEFTVNGSNPYDFGYSLNYHRPVSQDGNGNNCAYGPFKLSDKGGSGSGVGAGGFGSGRDANYAPDEFAPTALAVWDVGKLLSQTVKITSGAQTPQSCTRFEQLTNGVLDSTRDLVRFGLMTFDQDTDPGTGTNAGPPLTNLAANVFTGQWSYYPQWDGTTWPSPVPSPLWATGNPPACTAQLFEVGARNPAAPMWEGRLVRFPDPASSITDLEANNEYVQQVLLNARPYGATPIQGLVWDAREYFYFDPNGPTRADPYTYSSGGVGCRKQYMILMTDGSPNLDLETVCQTGSPSGKCPFTVNTNNDRTEDIVKEMYNGGPSNSLPQVTTFVIGFAMNSTGLSAPSPTTCSGLVDPTTGTWTTGSDVLCGVPTTGNPNPPQPAQGTPLEACCTLEKIAIAGNPVPSPGAYFVENGADLGKAFAAILGQITNKSSSRTVPTYTPVINSVGNSFAVSSQFLAAFDTQNPSPSKAQLVAWPWAGNLQRIRTVCGGTPLAAQAQTISASKGDDFSQNLNKAADGARNFITVKDQATSNIDSTSTLRQYVSSSNVDGAGTRAGVEVGLDLTNKILPGLTSSNKVPYMGINVNCPAFSDTTGTKFSSLSPVDCANAVLAFAMGQSFTTTNFLSSAPYGQYDFAGHFSRASGNANGFSAFGAILHSNPVIVPPPAAQLRDDSYRQFATFNATRPQVLYVATIDGLLHAFDVSSDAATVSTNNGTAINANFTGPANNELWSFIPPAVLPTLRSNYPGGGMNLLDGSPVAKDVVFARTSSETSLASKWHSVLVGSLGGSGRGYYALDVTDPLVSAGNGHSAWAASTGTTLPATPATVPAAGTAPSDGAGPHFLWQMGRIDTLVSGEVELFGKHSATPAISTFAFDPTGAGNQTKVQEIGVAILPGGIDDGPYGECARYSGGGPHTNSDATPVDDHWQPRIKVRQWSASGCSGGVSGRSVTIVRLDTGEIVRTFGRYSATQPTQRDIPDAVFQKVGTFAGFDSPMIGTPVVYPAQVGAVARKFFVGDADGTLWRFDVSDINPANWKAEMFFDTFSQDVMRVIAAPGTGNRGIKPTTDDDWADVSQPISVLPITSLDRLGNLVLHIATGDQDTFASTVFRPGKDNDTDDLLAAYNFVYSVTEVIDSTSSPVKTRASVNWYYPFADGERVTGPMAVFDSNVYFASFAPSAGSACGAGEGRIWGVDFVNVLTGCSNGNTNGAGTKLGCAGNAAMTPLAGSGSPVQFVVPGGTGTGQDPDLVGHVISGVGVLATPPCATVGASTDQFAGGGSYTSLTNMTQASYSIAAGVATKATAKNDVNQSGASFQAKIATPKMSTTIDSWAAIVE